MEDMAYYLSRERNDGTVKAYQNYQRYLRANEQVFPQSAYALATAEWYQNPRDHRCPHDAWLDHICISENADGDDKRRTTIRTLLVAPYHDGCIELVYPTVYRYRLDGIQCLGGLGDWEYDEFTLANDGHVIHEIEWAEAAGERARWIIEASDVEFKWIPMSSVTA